MAPNPWGRAGSAQGKPVVTPFFLNFHLRLYTLIPHILHQSCPKDCILFLWVRTSLSQCVQRAVTRESSPVLTSSDACYLFSDWVISCHVSLGCCSLCVTYDWVWLSLPSYISFHLCQAQTLPRISVPTLWHALLRYFWGRGQMRCLPQIVLTLQWNGDGPEITGTSHHLHQIALLRNSAAASDPF